MLFLEATKSLCNRVRTMSGLILDGVELFQKAFSIKNSYVAYNSLAISSELNQWAEGEALRCDLHD